MSFDEARFAFSVDAPQTIDTSFYLLSDNGYGYISSSSNLNLNIIGDLDAYAMHLDVGTSYGLIAGDSRYNNLYGINSAINPNIALADRFGNILAFGVDMGVYSALTFTATDSLYYLVAYAESSGLYGVSWINNDAVEINGVGESIALNGDYGATLDFSSDVDKFLFYAEAGVRLYFELSETVGDIFFDVVTASGLSFSNLVTSSNGTYTFDVVESGFYDLNLSSNSFYRTGSYSFYFTDALRSFSSINLIEGADVKAELIGVEVADITGNSNNNVLAGNGAANVLNGLTGADWLIGGFGNDTYITDGADTITELLSAGTDTVRSSVSYALGVNIENLILTGTAAINGTGNTLNNVITGNGAANTLNGITGVDRLSGGLGNDTYITDGGDAIIEGASAGTDTVRSSATYTLGVNIENLVLTASAAINGTGNTLNNVITGNGAANTLNGSTGVDKLIGGLGNDTYITDGGDTITEALSAGTDTVRSSVSHTLGANLENLVLTGSAAINGTGNTLNNVITGNAAANTLNGATGADRLSGGLGNDTYITDGGETITEALSEGTDTVRSSVSYTLGANLENLVLTGASLINGTGNTLNNAITGNAAANTLNGGIGNDTLNGGTGNDRLIGGVGNDTYVINGGDTIVEAAASGTDSVQSTVGYTLGLNLENLTLTGSGAINGTGNTLNNAITGNGAANTLNGGTGNDRITGGLGKDTLVGGVGTDTFVFNKISESTTVSTTWDIITDFTKGQDKIDLRNIDAFGPSAANDAFLWKGTAAFSSASAGEARFQKYDNAGTVNDYTVVFLDNDADTAVEMAIRLNGLHNLAATDFMV